jgi:guanylate kinase
MPGQLFIVTAPSGAGKSSLVKAWLEQDTAMGLSISYTTRPPRPGEVDGVNYHFVDRDTFMAMQGRGEFLESAEIYGHYYGTSQPWIEAQVAAGRDILLEIDWQGAAQVRKLMPQAESIFILPPSIAELRRRLEGRGTDSAEVIARRMAMAREEISHALEADYLVVNDVFETALADLLAIARARRLRMDVQGAAQVALMASLLND